MAERFDPINEENNYNSVSLCFDCCNIYSFLVVVGGAKALKCAFMDAIECMLNVYASSSNHFFSYVFNTK